MECVPRCVTCTGLCSAVPKSRPIPDAPRDRPAPIRRPTQFRLTCGCVTTPKEQVLWARLAPKRKPYWCARHDRWTTKARPAKAAELPDYPMF